MCPEWEGIFQTKNFKGIYSTWLCDIFLTQYNNRRAFLQNPVMLLFSRATGCLYTAPLLSSPQSPFKAVVCWACLILRVQQLTTSSLSRCPKSTEPHSRSILYSCPKTVIQTSCTRTYLAHLPAGLVPFTQVFLASLAIVQGFKNE